MYLIAEQESSSKPYFLTIRIDYEFLILNNNAVDEKILYLNLKNGIKEQIKTFIANKYQNSNIYINDNNYLFIKSKNKKFHNRIVDYIKKLNNDLLIEGCDNISFTLEKTN